MLRDLLNLYNYVTITNHLTYEKVHKMHESGKLALYIEQVHNAYKRIEVRNKKQALKILNVKFHNQNIIGALNEELIKEQKSNPGYAISCCIGLSSDPSWSSICRRFAAVNSTIAGYVSDKYQVLEIDKQEDGEIIFAVLEHKSKFAEEAHNLFWAHYCNNERVRARQMALAMKPVWNGQLASYYDMMYRRLIHN